MNQKDLDKTIAILMDHCRPHCVGGLERLIDHYEDKIEDLNETIDELQNQIGFLDTVMYDD